MSIMRAYRRGPTLFSICCVKHKSKTPTSYGAS